VLRQLKNSGAASISFDKLDSILRKAGVQQFNYETFVAAHQSDEKLKNIVKNFDQTKIQFKQSEVDDLNAPQDGADDVSAMAKRATDVGDTL